MRRFRPFLVLALVAAAASCGESPTEFCERNPTDPTCDDTVVSDTEIWKLELEQLGDGGTSLYPRRGTITLRLRLNRTSQPDPTCEGHPAGDTVTTFLAEVQAFDSRLQNAATGSADGSWNCHGLAATVRLSGGTRYELRSSDALGRGGQISIGWQHGDDVRWTAGVRAGVFALGPASESAFDHIRESHVDVLVQNLTGGEAWIRLVDPVAISSPLEIDYQVPGPVPVPVGGTLNASWPAHGAWRDYRQIGVPPPVALEGRAMFVWGPSASDDWYASCLLAPDHGRQVQLLIHANGPECGEGWTHQAVYVAPARSPLYIRAGTQAVQDTVTVLVTIPDELFDPATQLSVENPDPAVTGVVSGELLTVTVSPQAARGEHGVWLIGRLLQGGSLVQADTVFLPVYVYDLDVTTAADTLTIGPGGADTTSLLVDGRGYFSNIRFSATDLPAGVLESVPSFAPTTTDRFQGAASVLTVAIDAAAQTGTYGLTICTTIVDDPLARCHATPLALVVIENTPPTAIIHEPFDGGEYEAGRGIAFRGSATDAEDGTLSGTSLVWTSSLDGEIGTGTLFERADLSAGAHTITLTATDTGGATGSASVAITITDEPPATGSIVGTVSLNGQGLDDVGVVIEGPVTGAAVTNPSGQFFFFNLPNGSYTVSISGYPPGATFPFTSTTVTVQSGQVEVVFAGST